MLKVAGCEANRQKDGSPMMTKEGDRIGEMMLPPSRATRAFSDVVTPTASARNHTES